MRPVLPSRISQPFADPGEYASDADAHGPKGHHTGIDYGSFVVPIAGKVVRSILNGQVVRSEPDTGAEGQWVGVYNHKNDLLVMYWHLAERHVSVGDWVLAWHDLGLVGDTGNSPSGAHLHVQVNRGRTYDYDGHIDPAVALAISPTRREASARFKALGGVHPEEEKS
jgi:murein DD-endopeptidase MepM/ murein hydrolase activator NlpD